MTAQNIRTDEKLLARLQEAAKRDKTPEEVERQRLSLIYSGLPKDSSLTKIQIRQLLNKAS